MTSSKKLASHNLKALKRVAKKLGVKTSGKKSTVAARIRRTPGGKKALRTHKSKKASRKSRKASRKSRKASRKSKKASRKSKKASRKSKKASRKSKKASRKSKKASK